MFYEDKVASFPALKRRLRILDQDEGIRLVARSGKKKSLVFVTRFGPKYTVMTYAMTKGGAPGKRLRTQELDGTEVDAALEKVVGGRLQAWVY